MAKKHIKLPSMSRVVAGSTAVLEIPVQPTYHNITFTVTGTALALGHIGKIRVLANGKEVQTFKNLERLIDRNKYYGLSADTVGQFMLHFVDQAYNDLAYKRSPAFGTADLQTFTIEMDLAANAPADINIKAQAFIDTVPQRLGVYSKIGEYYIASSVAGVVENDKLPKAGDVYKAIHLYKADIGNVELYVDQVQVMDVTKALLERAQKNVWPVPRVPQSAKATHVDFVLEGDPGDLLNTKGVTDLRLKMDFATAGACDIVTETFAVWNG